jgi:hypothetical protein
MIWFHVFPTIVLFFMLLIELLYLVDLFEFGLFELYTA